jgi:hypothetical protein
MSKSFAGESVDCKSTADITDLRIVREPRVAWQRYFISSTMVFHPPLGGLLGVNYVGTYSCVSGNFSSMSKFCIRGVLVDSRVVNSNITLSSVLQWSLELRQFPLGVVQVISAFAISMLASQRIIQEALPTPGLVNYVSTHFSLYQFPKVEILLYTVCFTSPGVKLTIILKYLFI